MSERASHRSMWPAGSKFARPEDSVGFLLWQALHLWQRRATAGLADLDLTHMQFTILAGVGWLGRDGTAPNQTAVAAHCRLDLMTVSQILRTLEKKGFLVRAPDETDGRAKALRLTDNGAAALASALPRIDAMDTEFFAACDVEVLMAELGAVYRAHGEGPNRRREDDDSSR